MATDHNFKVKNGLTVQGETLVVNHTGDLSGTQVYIKKKDESTNLMRWGEGTSGASTYRWRIDQSYDFIGNNAGVDYIVLKASDGSIRGQSYKVGSTEVIDSSRNLTDINSLRVSGTSGIAIGTSPSGFGTGVSTILLQGTSSTNGRAGALWFKEYDGSNTTALYSTDGADGYGTVLAAYQGSIKFGIGGIGSSNIALTIDTSKNATFAGTISSGAITASGSSVFNPTSDMVIVNEPSTNTDLQTAMRVGTAAGGLYFTSSNAIISKGAYYDGSWIATATGGSSIDFTANDRITFNTFSGATVGGAAALSARAYIDSTGLNVTGGVTVGNGAVYSNTNFAFLTTGNAAQNIRTKSVFAGTSYGDTPPAGSFNATNTYEVNGATVIDSSRNITAGTISSGSITSSGTITANGISGSSFYGITLSRSSTGITTPDIWGQNGTLVLGTSSGTECVGFSGANATFYGTISSNAITATTLKETDGGDGFTEIGSSSFGYFSWGIEIANPNNGYSAIRFAGKKKYFVLEADVLGTNSANHTGMFWGNTDGTAILGGSTTGFKTTHQNSTSFHIRDINGNADQETYNPAFSPSDGNWHHQKIMATPDGYVRIWIDGDLKFEETGYIPSAEGYLGFVNYAGTVRYANIRCRTINEDESQHYSHHIGNPNGAYADDDRFIKLANNTANSTGTLVTADNGNTWLNADGGKDLWLNWVSLNNKSSKADLQVGDGNYGAAIFSVDATNRRVGVNDTSPSYSLDVNGTARITGTLSSGAITSTGKIIGTELEIGSSANSGYLSGDASIATNGYMMATAIVNNSETGANPAAITFGNGPTLGNDQISLITGGQRRIYISSTGAVDFGSGNLSSIGDLDVDGIIDNTRNNGNVAAPNNSDHTAGTRIKFYDSSATSFYAIGIEGNTMWFNSDVAYKWYQDATLRMHLDGSNLNLVTGAFQVNGTTVIDNSRNITATSLRPGVDNAWKIRPNSGNAQLAFEYSTSTALSDTNIKAELGSGGDFIVGDRLSNKISGYQIELKKASTSIGDGGGAGALNLRTTGNFYLRHNGSDALTFNGSTITSSDNFSVSGAITISGNGEELLFTGGNNRIRFSGYRAMEGTTDGANLYIAETYTNTTVMSNLNISSGHALRHNGTTVVDNARVVYGTAFNGTGYLYTANKALDVLSIDHTGTPTQYLITTNIPYTSGNHMPTIKIQGYAYGNAETVDITISWYIYNGNFTSYTASSSGSWAPDIHLAQNSSGKVVIHLAEGFYYAKMSVSVESGLNMMSLTRDQMASWSWSDAACPNSNKVAVSYKQKFPGVTELDGGKLYFASTNYGVGAGGHNLNSVYVDTLESGTSTDALELVYYQGPGVNIGNGATKYLNASTLGATTSSTPSGPGTTGYYTANGLQFGGNNNGKESNSAQISAAEHQSNSLNFVGLGTSSSNRRMDFWVEGGAYFRGSIIATGNVTAYGSASDERLKTNIVKIENPIAKLQSVAGYTFDWNENAPEDKQGLTEYGVIAQEVEKAGLNELVFEYERPVNQTGGDDTPPEQWKAVHYEKFVPILIEAIKEQQEKIEKLEELVEKLISEK